MQRIYINRKKCDLETCKIEGVDMNSILLEKCGWEKNSIFVIENDGNKHFIRGEVCGRSKAI